MVTKVKIDTAEAGDGLPVKKEEQRRRPAG